MYVEYVKPTGEEKVKEISQRHTSGRVDPKELSRQVKTAQDVARCGETDPLAR